MRAVPFAAALLLAGCAQLPPTPEDIQAKRFQTIPDKAVIYIVRAPLDSTESSELYLHGMRQISMHRGTYYRWEVPPGTYRITGMGAGAASATVTGAPGRIYFLKYTVIGDPTDGGVQVAALQAISERTGRDLVSTAELVR
jgi:hypothetical protein